MLEADDVFNGLEPLVFLLWDGPANEFNMHTLAVD